MKKHRIHQENGLFYVQEETGFWIWKKWHTIRKLTHGIYNDLVFNDIESARQSLSNEVRDYYMKEFIALDKNLKDLRAKRLKLEQE